MISKKAESELIKAINEIQELNEVDNKALLERVIKFNEEYGEMNAELCKLLGITHKSYDKEHMKEEIADFLQNAFSLTLALSKFVDIESEEIFTKMLEKNQKWRDKYPQYTKNQ